MKMKALIITLIVILSTMVSSAQTSVKVDANGNYIALAPRKDTAKAKATGKTFTDSKGQKYPVYESVNGKLFIIRTSKKTGNQYKQYLKLG